MAKKRTYRKTRRSEQEIAKDRALRTKFQGERPTLAGLVKSGEYTQPIKQGEYLSLMQWAADFRAARDRLNLSLGDVSKRTGIDKAAISRLENGLTVNPTVQTLERLARSVGKRLNFELVDSATPKT